MRTFSTNSSSIAALLITLYPRLPTGPNDNRCHLQVYQIAWIAVPCDKSLEGLCSLLFEIMLFWRKSFSGISPSICPCNRGTMGSDSWCWHRSACLCSSWGHNQRNWTLCWIKLLRGHSLPPARKSYCKSELSMNEICGYFNLYCLGYHFWYPILLFELILFDWFGMNLCPIVQLERSICRSNLFGFDGCSWKEYVFVGLATGLKW